MKRDDMKCGNCGDAFFKLRSLRDKERVICGIETACMNCGSTSIVKVQPAHLMIAWGEGAQGVITDGWSS